MLEYPFVKAETSKCQFFNLGATRESTCTSFIQANKDIPQESHLLSSLNYYATSGSNNDIMPHDIPPTGHHSRHWCYKDYLLTLIYFTLPYLTLPYLTLPYLLSRPLLPVHHVWRADHFFGRVCFRGCPFFSFWLIFDSAYL